MPTEKKILDTFKAWAFTGTMGFVGFMGYRMVDSLDKLRLEVAGMKVMLEQDHIEINRLRDGLSHRNIPDTDHTFEREHMLATIPDRMQVKTKPN